jgi:hypothetical protein
MGREAERMELNEKTGWRRGGDESMRWCMSA